MTVILLPLLCLTVATGCTRVGNGGGGGVRVIFVTLDRFFSLFILTDCLKGRDLWDYTESGLHGEQEKCKEKHWGCFFVYFSLHLYTREWHLLGYNEMRSGVVWPLANKHPRWFSSALSLLFFIMLLQVDDICLRLLYFLANRHLFSLFQMIRLCTHMAYASHMNLSW